MAAVAPPLPSRYLEYAKHNTRMSEAAMRFILSIGFTEQGIRTIKDAPKRVKGARELAKKLGVEIKELYLTTGEHDLLAIVDAASGDNVAKFVLALAARGNVRTRMSRAWSEAEYMKLIAELP